MAGVCPEAMKHSLAQGESVADGESNPGLSRLRREWKPLHYGCTKNTINTERKTKLITYANPSITEEFLEQGGKKKKSVKTKFSFQKITAFRATDKSFYRRKVFLTKFKYRLFSDSGKMLADRGKHQRNFVKRLIWNE